MAAFLVKLVELVAKPLLIGRRIPSIERKRDDVVHMEGVRNGDEITALQGHDEWLVAARLVDVVEEAKALQDVQRPWRIAHPVSVPADRMLAGRHDDALGAVGD